MIVGELPLFLYGTLMSTGGRAAVVGPGRRGPAIVCGALYLLPAGYPALQLHGSGHVHGEWVDPVSEATLRRLDLYEGVHEGLYTRVVVSARTENSRFDAWAWVMNDALQRGGRRIASGRWRSVRSASGATGM